MVRFSPPRFVMQRGPWQQRSAHTYQYLRPSFYTAFLTYYAVIFAYGMTAGLLGVFTIRAVTGAGYATLWGYGVALAGACAATGLILSARWRLPWVEVIATCVLLGLMAGYCLAVVINAVSTGQPARLPAAWLPVLVSVFPCMRVVWIANDGVLLRRREESE